MGRHYVLSRFLRQTPNHLLKQYFAARALLGTVDFDTPKEREIDAIQQAIIALPETDRQKVESDFRDIDALASERGFRAMMDEAAWHVRNNPQQYGDDRDLIQRLANFDGEHARAMWVFLNRTDYWHGAMRFFEADMVAPSYWQKRKNLPRLDPRLDAATFTAFAHALGRYFHVMHGRGTHCHVEALRRNELYYLFCFGQDFCSGSPRVGGREARQTAAQSHP